MAGDPEGEPKRAADDDAWIEKVVKLGAAVGLNPMRTRWKLIRWQERRRQARRRLEQKVEHVRYAHKTCDQCGAVQDRDEKTCSRCEAKLGRREFQVLRRIGLSLPVPMSVSTLLALACVAVYVRELVAAGGGLGSPGGHILVELGGRWAPSMSAEPWRLVTAVFLHAGIWHLAFNLIAIASIGPRIEELYGRWTMLFLFIATGVLANIGSGQMVHYGVGIGASGGVMGLIGVAMGYGQRAKTWSGRNLRDDMLKWSGYTIVFGFAIGADNWAHLFGVISGAVFGFFVAPGWWRMRRLAPLRLVLGGVAAAAMVAALALIFTRTPLPLQDLAQADRMADVAGEVFDSTAAVCRKHWAGDDLGARQAWKALAEHVNDRSLADADLEKMCNEMLELRSHCRSVDLPTAPHERRAAHRICAEIERTLSGVPMPASPPPR
ncbi:MAG: Rhomboid family protein [Myxococcales bacterium]|nr:Rhomboid family protein [Myxococcales bacterium]